MLVTVAVLVIIMTVMVQIFQSATGALSAAQTIQDLDNQLKLLDTTIRSDLGGVHGPVHAAPGPAQNRGISSTSRTNSPTSRGKIATTVFVHGQGAPGQPFTGRMWVTPAGDAIGFYNPTVQPVTMTSEYAEIIYFLRNGNLYRRVLLIAPGASRRRSFRRWATSGFLPSNLATA